ncbi:MAG: hemerythrin domain-containing protein [Kiloniellales bacterium]|nr:hemerythrin domain-containing protein [Kiloniellales bacterium]
MAEVTEILRLEHHRIGAVLSCLRYHIEEIDAGRAQPDFEILFTILDYIEGFPETFHHPKEDHLFEAVSGRSADAAELVEHLRSQHVESIDLLTKLRAALDSYRRDLAAFPGLRDRVGAYVDFQYAHMRSEESELLPIAAEVLQEQDWEALLKTFVQSEDPLFGVAREAQFEALYRRILELFPGSTLFGRHH